MKYSVPSLFPKEVTMNVKQVEQLVLLIVAPLEHMRRKNVLVFVNNDLFTRDIGRYELDRLLEIAENIYMNQHDFKGDELMHARLILYEFTQRLKQITDRIEKDLRRTSQYN